MGASVSPATEQSVAEIADVDLSRPLAHIAEYLSKRGIGLHRDFRGRIDGDQCESLTSDELVRSTRPMAFGLTKPNVRNRSGLFRSGNDEYLFRRQAGRLRGPGEPVA